MEMQVNNLDDTFDLDDINVVVGFKKDLIMERFPELTYIYNPFFDQTNTSKSLLKALRKNRDKSVLWLNGDKLSKTVKNGLGEAVGINFIAAKDIKSFITRLEQCDDNDYFERGLELAIEKDGLKISAVDISDYNCMEVDFKEDLENANTLFRK